MASAEKVLSLFEPHTRAIPRDIRRCRGRVWAARHRRTCVEGGLVTRYAILEQPNEHGQALEAVSHHRKLFGRAPRLVACDRGVHSPQTEEVLTKAGVKLVAIPASGTLSEERQALERTRSFKRGYRWRAGIEGRITSLRRDFGWRRSGYHGPDGIERWLGLGVLASNLRRIALARHH